MVRILFIVLTFLMGWFIGKALSELLSNRHQVVKNIENSHLVQSNGSLKLQKTDIDYWYEKPHWYVFADGTKINLSEYFTYDEWKNFSDDKKMQRLTQIKMNLNEQEKTKIEMK